MQGSSFQSTHPVWGATRKGEDVAVLHDKFQSTHPVWGATSQKESGKGLFGFQSTHPVWGATIEFGRNLMDLTRISIHAPRVGCDNREN